MTNIQVHLESKHATEDNVDEMLTLRRNTKREPDVEMKAKMSKELKDLQAIIRYEGDHLHNKTVIEQKRGELLLSRRTQEKEFRHSDYGPCPSCQLWLCLDSTLAKHQTVCVAAKGDPTTRVMKSTLVFRSGVLVGKRAKKGCSKRLTTEVFPSMKRDNVTELAQSDDLITALGEEWFTKGFDNKLRRRHFASFHMRQMTKILINLRKLAISNGNPELRGTPAPFHKSTTF